MEDKQIPPLADHLSLESYITEVLCVSASLRWNIAKYKKKERKLGL